KELNELMKSYIRVHMNEEMAKEVTIHNQLNQIQEKSDKVMSNMQSILNTQGKMLEENAENLQAILINRHEEMEKSNNKTIKAEQETRDLVSNAKHGALVTNIIDALKYGAATSAITIPVLYFLLS